MVFPPTHLYLHLCWLPTCQAPDPATIGQGQDSFLCRLGNPSSELSGEFRGGRCAGALGGSEPLQAGLLVFWSPPL